MAPLRNVIAGGFGGAIGAAGLCLTVGGIIVSGPIGWLAVGAGALGALFGVAQVGASVSASTDTVYDALQNGLLSGLRVGGQVLRLARSQPVRRPRPAVIQTGSNPLGMNLVQSIQESWTEELINDHGQRVAMAEARCDLDLSAQGSNSSSSFRMASGLAAVCDKCGKVLSIGNDWFHEGVSKRDLCLKHVSELTLTQRAPFQFVHSEAALGENARAYTLKVRVPADVFPQAGPRVEGKVVLEVAHLINHKDGKETLASMLKPLMPRASIDEYAGPRNFCRIVIDMKDESAVREIIKSLGQRRNKRVSIKEIYREFHSPRS